MGTEKIIKEIAVLDIRIYRKWYMAYLSYIIKA